MAYCSYCHRVSCLPIQKISRIERNLSNLKSTALITEFECEAKAIAMVPFNRTNWMWKLSFMFLEIFNCNQISWHDVSPWILPNLCVRTSRCFSCFEGENSISDFRLQSGIPLDWMSDVWPVFVVDDDTSALTYEKITKLFASKKIEFQLLQCLWSFNLLCINLAIQFVCDILSNLWVLTRWTYQANQIV